MNPCSAILSSINIITMANERNGFYGLTRKNSFGIRQTIVICVL